jgi:hypothetical protein
MKKKLLLFLTLTAMLNVANAQDITVFDFDGTTPTFSSWSDSFVSVANPVPDGVNASANVGMYTHNNQWSDIAADVDIDPRFYTSFQVKVYSPNAGTLSISGRNAANGELFNSSNVLTIGAGWTTITQNIVSTQQIKKIVLRFNFGATPAGGPADVVYIDDLKFIKTTNTDISLYAENFYASWSQWGSWTDKPSTQVGNWTGGINLQTTADANMTLERWWDANEHVLKIAPTAAAVTIPNINIAGFQNLKLAFENKYAGGSSEDATFYGAPDANRLPVIEIKSGTGAWAALTVAAFTSSLTTQNITLPAVDNTQPLSIRISANSTYTFAIDNLKLIGKSASLGTNSNQLSDNSIQFYPNPFVNEFTVVKSEGPLQVSVFDVLGRKAETSKSSSSQLSMGSSLKPGLYIVKVEGANAKDSKSFKVIKK